MFKSKYTHTVPLMNLADKLIENGHALYAPIAPRSHVSAFIFENGYGQLLKVRMLDRDFLGIHSIYMQAPLLGSGKLILKTSDENQAFFKCISVNNLRCYDERWCKAYDNVEHYFQRSPLDWFRWLPLGGRN